MSDIMSYLFETNAIRFCTENKPFWYTSGKIGPYFINTHFIYGSEEQANELLSYIDECLEDKISLPKKVFKRVLEQYKNNKIYKIVIDSMKECIEKNINIEEIDYISGGERRDWFFSNIIAYLLNKPHISIYKDLSVVISSNNFESTEVTDALEGKKVLHIADLVNFSSSYIRAWIPAIEALKAKMKWTCVVVDRMQGGREKIEEKGVEFLALTKVDTKLFNKALDLKIINNNQYNMLNSYFENPDSTMRDFLMNHPEFLEEALNSDDKVKKRAKLLIDNNLYNL